MYYDFSNGTFISSGELFSLYGSVPDLDTLKQLGIFPYIDPLAELNSNYSPFIQQSGITEQGGNAYQNYIQTPASVSLVYQLSQFLNSTTGTVAYLAGTFVPPGYLRCDGSIYYISEYPTLAAVLLDTYGGDGVTTFGVPDLRGQFIRGWDNGAGVDPGRVFGSTQDDAFEAHSHITPDNGGAAGAKTVAGTVSKVENYTTGGNTSSTGGTETRPKNVALLPCIFSGVYVAPNPVISGTIATSRTGNDFNDSSYVTFYSTSLVESDTELFIPSTSTVIPYILPTQFNAFSEAFNTGDYRVQIREVSTGVVLANFICPEAPAVPVSF